jgi:hypothetical protein
MKSGGKAVRSAGGGECGRRRVREEKSARGEEQK